MFDCGDCDVVHGASALRRRLEVPPVSPWRPVIPQYTIEYFNSDPKLTSALDLIFSLLEPDPSLRMGLWTQQQVKEHVCFQSVNINWDDVDQGRSPPPNADFDRGLGQLEFLADSDGKEADDTLSTDQQKLFDGF
jgi:hypothetical protein